MKTKKTSKTIKYIKNIFQLVVAFILAFMGYSTLYEPHQETVRAAVRENTPTAVTQQVQKGKEALSLGPVSGELRITLFDVGQADAILLQDGKTNVMIDVGDSRQDKMKQGGRAVLEQRLAKAGVNRIKTVFVTHHHADHMGNIKWMAGKYGISNIYDNGYANSNSTTSQWLNTELRAGHYHGKALKAGDRILLGKNYYIDVLAPGDFIPSVEMKNLNNTSLVLMLHYGKFKMLLTGDAEAGVEDALQKKYGSDLKADVLKVGHHGSRTSSYYPFTSKVKPNYALISCGDFSIYHHPHKNTVGSLQHLGAKVYTTHDRGNLTVITDGSTVKVQTEK